MDDLIRQVRNIAPNARLDCCPYTGGEDGNGFFIRLGMAGHWLSLVRKTPRGAWSNAAARLQAPAIEPPRAPRADLDD